ncbi:MAG: phosphatidylserine decarboxylase [Gammaproteobacteria bacterium]|nr:phosphatidylserine decarboxylase [Gammaproteobacteria bacterium]
MNSKHKMTKTGWDSVVTLPQYIIPHHLLSLAMYALTRTEIAWFKNLFIRFIVKQYKVNVAEAAQTDLNRFPSFNAFFTRELRTGARTIAQGQHTVVSPVDGVISQLGPIKAGQIVQAKGFDYSVLSLLAGDVALANEFEQGQFATIYLSPRDYHRIHMPLTGTLREMIYVPGKLFSVSPRTARTVPDLFARNERVITVFDTEQGPLVVVLVGAIFVGSMETVWAGQITPPYGKKIQRWTYNDAATITLNKGEELGRFNMGSTVVMLLPKQSALFLSRWSAQSPIQLGQAMN